FFFQAEDGIRDLIVTGVQTCALPISASYANAKDAALLAEEVHSGEERGIFGIGVRSGDGEVAAPVVEHAQVDAVDVHLGVWAMRSEERRVGKEGRAGWAT